MRKMQVLTFMLGGMLLLSLATSARSATDTRHAETGNQAASPGRQGTPPVVDKTLLLPGELPAEGTNLTEIANPFGSMSRDGSLAMMPPVILDDFNRANGPLGPNWTVHNGTCSISGGAATCGGMGRATFEGAAMFSGNAAEADVAVNGTSLEYVGLLLNYGAGVSNLFIKVQQQSASGQFSHAGCYTGNNGGPFGLGFFSLTSPFSTAHMRVVRQGDEVTLEFTNVDGGAQADQVYVCTGAPPAEGNGIGILGYNGIALLDNFAVPDYTVTWDKSINGTPWQTSMTITVQTSDTIMVEEVLHLNVPELAGRLPARQSAPPSAAAAVAPSAVGFSPAVEEVGLAEAAPMPAAAPVEWFAPESVLHDNGPLVTHPGVCSGQDASRLQADLGMSTFGFGHQVSEGNHIADDFTISDVGGWQIDTITFFAYQTSAPSSPSPITGVYYQIWDGPPNDPGSSVVFGDLVTNRLLSSTFTNIQRDSASSPCANTRYIFANVASAGVTLLPGTYWLDWMTEGSASYTGPWAPPITIMGQTTTGNALQYTASSSAWGPANDSGTHTQQGMPFIIEGHVIQPRGGRLYLTSLDVTGAGSDNFAVYLPLEDRWVSLTPYETGCQMAVSKNGDLYAYNHSTAMIDRYDPDTDTWSAVMAAPPGASGEFCNLEITKEGKFLYTEANASTLWYTSAGVWNTFSLPFLANVLGDYDPLTGQYVIGEWMSTTAHLIDLDTLGITDFWSPVFNGEYARFGTVMGNRYYFHADASNIFSFDLSNPSAAPFDHGISPGLYNSSAADRMNTVIYTADLNGIALSRFDVSSGSLTPLADGPGAHHSSLAYVPSPSYALVETWDADHLSLVDWQASSGAMTLLSGQAIWSGEIITSTTVTLTKWFRVQPCDWTTTWLHEQLLLNSMLADERPVGIHKLPPNLWIDANYQPEVVAGQTFSFTLTYGNTGGYENDVRIRNTFPVGAPFVSSVPPPTSVDPNGLWAEWALGDIASGNQGSITVSARLEPGVPVSSTFLIWDGIYDHLGRVTDAVTLTFHVEPFVVEWEKSIDGVPWASGMQITRQTSDTIVIEDVLRIGPPTMLFGSMRFEPVRVSGGPTANPGLTVSAPMLSPMHLPEAPARPEAVLWDQPLSAVNQNSYVNQDFLDYPAYSSFLADDFANAAPWEISTIFVPGDGWNAFTTLANAASLNWQIYADCSGVPCGNPSGGGIPPVWTLTLPPTDPQVTLSTGTSGYPSNTTLELAAPLILPPGHWWLIFWPALDFGSGGQYGRQPADTHNGYIAQFINPGNGFGYGTDWQNWNVLGPTQHDLAFRLEGQALLQAYGFELTEAWAPAHLRLVNWTASHGDVTINPSGELAWTGEFSQTIVITLTKWFVLEPCTWTQTVLTETLWLNSAEVEQRPLTVNKISPSLWIDANYQPEVVAGQTFSFTLTYGNTGGYENDVRIRNTFPAGAPFVSSVPPPTSVDANGLWAEWAVGNLPSGSQGSITVTVQIASGLPFGTILHIWDGIYNHLSVIADQVDINLQIVSLKLFLPLIKK